MPEGLWEELVIDEADEMGRDLEMCDWVARDSRAEEQHGKVAWKAQCLQFSDCWS